MNLNKLSFLFAILILTLFIISCDDDDGTGGGDDKASIFIENTARFEGEDGTTILPFRVKSDIESTTEIKVDFTTEDVTAVAGEDYESQAGTITIPAGAREVNVEIVVLGDTIFEIDETFNVVLSNAVNADISGNTAVGTIRNDDVYAPTDDEGYSTPTSYTGYTMAWADEFNTSELNTDDWNYETGDNGWGNNELQNYQSGTSNAYQANGKLVIEARGTESSYTSARITTQGKQSFKYGRVDIRAKLPEGQGIWPALWMLGESFATIGWPECGEIDIMELVGHEPNKVHGTVHWDNQGAYASYGDNTSLSSGKFSDEYHVFSIIWDAQFIKWYMDDQLYNTIDISVGHLSEMQEKFFFIFNIAVGGNWPGSPDASTVFPQRMEVDYIRVFQEE